MPDTDEVATKPIGGVTRWAKGMLIACISTSLLAEAADVTGTLMFPTWNVPNAPLTSGFETALVLAVTLFAVAYILSFVISAVFVCIWMYCAAHNLRVFGDTGLAISPGWAVGWWFIPFANLVMPYRAMREIYRGSEAAATASPAPLSTGSPLLAGWWACWLIDGLISYAAFRTGLGAESQTLEASVWLSAVSTATVGLVGTVLLLRILHDVDDWQSLAINQRS